MSARGCRSESLSFIRRSILLQTLRYLHPMRTFGSAVRKVQPRRDVYRLSLYRLTSACPSAFSRSWSSQGGQGGDWEIVSSQPFCADHVMGRVPSCHHRSCTQSLWTESIDEIRREGEGNERHGREAIFRCGDPPIRLPHFLRPACFWNCVSYFISSPTTRDLARGSHAAPRWVLKPWLTEVHRRHIRQLG